MRMDPESGESAAWLARADEREIADVLWIHGEGRQSRASPARSSPSRGQRRSSAPAAGGADRIGDAAWRRKIHPATRSFQAIRIHVNRGWPTSSWGWMPRWRG